MLAFLCLLAKNQVAAKSHNTYAIPLLSLLFWLLTHIFHSVFDAKRLIGRKFDDAEVQSDVKHFPFKVINNVWQGVYQRKPPR